MSTETKQRTEWEKLEDLVKGPLPEIKKHDSKILKDIRSDTGESLLHVACRTRLFENVEYLINEVGCDVNLEDSSEVTPLECALRSDDEKERAKIVGLFLRRVDLRACTRRIFQISILVQRLGQVLLLINGGVDGTTCYLRRGGWTLDEVAQLQDNELTSNFYVTDPSFKLYIEFLCTAKTRDLNELKWLVSSVADCKRVTSWALRDAALNNSAAAPMMVQLLLDFGAPVNGFQGDKETALYIALDYCKNRIVRVLLEGGAKIFNIEVFKSLARKLKLRNSYYSPRAEKCLRLCFEHLGLWEAGMEKNFDNIPFLRGNANAEKPIMMLVLEYMSREIVSESGAFLSLPYTFPKLEDYNTYYESCCKEIVGMISRKFKCVPYSLYDLLLKTTNELVALTRNEKLMKQIKSFRLVQIFPIHGTALENKLKEAREISKLKKKSEKTL